MDRTPLDEMTSDQLDQLYARIDTLEAVCLSNKRAYAGAVQAAWTAEAEVARMKELVAASSEPGHAVRRVVQLEAEVARLTAGQCTHACPGPKGPVSGHARSSG